LKDFQHCFKLRELFIRKNRIEDLHEVDYLEVFYYFAFMDVLLRIFPDL
jgi:hypothetical protein